MEDYAIVENLIDDFDILLSIVTVEELDHLKTNRDFTTATQARNAIRALEKLKYKIKVILERNIDEALVSQVSHFNHNDDIIVTTAKNNNAQLFTFDLNLCIKAIAIGVELFEIKAEPMYKGYREVPLDDNSLADFYSKYKEENVLGLNENEYLVLKNSDGDPIDIYKWKDGKHCYLCERNLSTMYFGNGIKAKDIQQKMVIDSIMSNELTAISGGAGSGKSFLSILCAMKLIETKKYERLTILFNPTKTRGSAEMGFYAGDYLEKALQSNIGQMLIGKFCDYNMVLQLIKEDKLRLISMADIRGLEVGATDIMYITEAQNTTKDLIKLCLSRAGDGCKIIIEGDYETQVDSSLFEGRNNGLISVINKLKGQSLFGYVALKNIYRSKIATLIENL